MAQKANTNKITFGRKRRRPGVHSKSKHSTNPNSRHYAKKYRGQGR